MAKDPMDASDDSSTDVSAVDEENGGFAHGTQATDTFLPLFGHDNGTNPSSPLQQQDFDLGFGGPLGNVTGNHWTSHNQPNTVDLHPLAPPNQQQFRPRSFPNQQAYRPVVTNPNQQISEGVAPPTKRKKTKKKKSPADNQGRFAQTQRNRTVLRGKHFPPLAPHDTNIAEDNHNNMAKTRSDGKEIATRTKRQNRTPSDQPITYYYHGKTFKVPGDPKKLTDLFLETCEELEQERGISAELKQKLEDVHGRLAEMTKNQPKLAVNQAMVEKIKEKVKLYLFRTVKFLSDEKSISNALEKLYDLLYPKDSEDRADKNHKPLFFATYKSVLTAKLNDHRSYAQNRMKDSWKRFHEKNNWIPTTGQIMKCALREISLLDESEVLIMDWYVHDMLSKCRVIFAILPIIVMPHPTLRLLCSFFLCYLPTKAKVLGNKLWPTGQGCHVELSKAKSLEGKRLLTVSTEAFIVTIYDSNRDKWKNMFQLYREQGSYTTTKLPAKLTKEERTKDPTKTDPFHDAKYTRQDGGQLEFGSFTEEGMDYFNEMCNKIQEQRKKKEEITDFEAKFRKILQDKYKKDSGDGKKKGKAARKSGDGGGQPAKKRRVIIFEDDEDEEGDE